MAKIFVSYRRTDSEGYAGRICDRLTPKFGSDGVFMDVDSINPGADFPSVLSKALADSYVLIAVVGQNWRGPKADHTFRLNDADDFVRQEIQSAIEKKITVIPLLVGGAKMPSAQELPEELMAFTNFNAVEIRHDKFVADMAALIQTLEALLHDYELTRAAEELQEQPPSHETRKFLRQLLGEPKGIGRLIFGPW
jgi:hypothetical protein